MVQAHLSAERKHLMVQARLSAERKHLMVQAPSSAERKHIIVQAHSSIPLVRGGRDRAPHLRHGFVGAHEKHTTTSNCPSPGILPDFNHYIQPIHQGLKAGLNRPLVP